MTTEPMPGGRRRIDRVLGEGFLDGLTELPLEEVRRRRAEAEQEEADLSYVRRMLQGRTDILRAELSRRSTEGGSMAAGGTVRDADLVARLTHVLADAPRADKGMGRHLSVEPSRVAEHRRAVEQIIADVGISDVSHQTEEQLRQSLTRLEDTEHAVSRTRRWVQQVMDACTAEVARRYREGEARIEDVLPKA